LSSRAKYDLNMCPAKFGIVIPCYNESGNLTTLIDQCEEIATSGFFEFVLVNNGSTDNSIEIMNRKSSANVRFIDLEKNLGYGGGIISGLSTLKTDYVGWTHADLQTDLISSMAALRNADFDFFKGIRLGRSPLERLLSSGMGLICSAIFRTKLHEINAQPTVMTKKLYDSWRNPPKDFSLDLYATLIAKQRNSRIVRSRFDFSKRNSGKSSWNTGLKSRVKMVSRTLKYAFALQRSGVN
jgi:glycosyltransferase involved in cell wall biosynthesis